MSATQTALRPGTAAQAYRVDYLCRTWMETPVFDTGTGDWMYSIPAGQDMAVSWISPSADPNGRDIFFGHGDGEPDGYSYSNYFSGCRPG